MYCVIRRESLPALEEKVNDMMAEGWAPQGGVAVFYSNEWDAPYFHQAMIEKEPGHEQKHISGG